MKSLRSLSLLALALASGATSCTMPAQMAMPIDARPTELGTSRQTFSANQPSTMLSEPQLYARDGSVVTQQAPGTLTVSPSTGHSSVSDPGGRWTLLEKYQSTMQRNEDVEVELRGLTRELEIADEEKILAMQAIEELRVGKAKLDERIGMLEGHNVELASRLTTAQIRRLQSEKLLLETKLDWKRVESALGAAPLAKPAEAEPTQ
ncbi:MAG: hypothetical protein ACI8X5_003510 [Planctomycetota bacterium]|jgi:hypothetical protein